MKGRTAGHRPGSHCHGVAAGNGWRRDAATRMFDSINSGDVDAFGDHLVEDSLEHEATPSQDPAKEGAKGLFKMMMAAFADLGLDAEDVISIGDKVVARSRVTGTSTGTFMGMSPTGEGVDMQAVDILRLGDARCGPPTPID